MNCRQNWSKACEEELNRQIDREYQASLLYHLLSNYFNRDNVGLNKLVTYFNKASLEERGHANQLMNYQNMRGGVVVFANVIPEDSYVGMITKLEQPNDIIGSFKIALDMEKNINGHLLELHQLADENNDAQFCDYLEGDFLKEQVEAISELSKIVSVLERFNNDQHAIWNFIQNL